jgi:hypothetical protein
MHLYSGAPMHFLSGVDNLADPDGIMDKARRWFGHLAAVGNASSEQLKLHIILGAPQDPLLLPAYDRAVALFRKADLNPEVVEEGDIDTLVDRIEDEVRAHDSGIAVSP